MASKEAIVIVLDIGQSSNCVLDSGPSFLDNAKTCIERIIERKLFAAPKDEISIVLLGTKESANELEYRHISEGCPMSCPSWNMLRSVQSIEGTDVERADWVDALIVAMDIIQKQHGKKFSAKKIVLFTTLDSDVCSDKLDTIIGGLQKLEIELTAIGVEINLEVKSEPKDDEMDVDEERPNHETNSEDVLRKILKSTEGIACSFQDAIPQLLYHQSKSVRATPWNVCLDIGPDIKIPISGFKKIADVSLPSWKVGTKGPATTESNIQAGIMKSSNSSLEEKNSSSSEVKNISSVIVAETDVSYYKEDQTTVSKDELIPAYYFGSSLVPFTENDKEMMNYRSGDRSLSVLGFASQNDVPRKLLSGDGVYYFVAPKDCPEAQPALSALIKALHLQKKVAVVRKIYNNGNMPVLGAMFPLLKEDFNCLMLIEIPYSEEVNEYIFPRVVLDKEKPSREQLNAVDAFIDSMDLMNEQLDDDDEPFNPEFMISPALAHSYRCISHRALHPDDPLPPLADDIKNMLKSPFESDDCFKEALAAVKQQFELVVPESKPKKKKKWDEEDYHLDISAIPAEPDAGVAATELVDLAKDSVIEVGTNKPEEDFLCLLDKGEQFTEVCKQMQRVILNLVIRSLGSNDFPKALGALKTLRSKCVNKRPEIYNDWLASFKENLLERDRDAFWDLVVKNGLGLITSEENGTSTISPQAAEDFLKISQPEAHPEMNEDEMDADDLLNEM